MTEIEAQNSLMLSIERALSGTAVASLHQASFAVDFGKRIVQIRYQVDIGMTLDEKELLSIATTEVIADLWESWQVTEEYLVSQEFPPLAYVVYRK